MERGSIIYEGKGGYPGHVSSNNATMSEIKDDRNQSRLKGICFERVRKSLRVISSHNAM